MRDLVDVALTLHHDTHFVPVFSSGHAHEDVSGEGKVSPHQSDGLFHPSDLLLPFLDPMDEPPW